MIESGVIEIPCDAGIQTNNENLHSSTGAVKKKKKSLLHKNHKRTKSNLSLNDCESIKSKRTKPKLKSVNQAYEKEKQYKAPNLSKPQVQAQLKP